MGKEIQIVGQDNRPIIEKAFNLNEGNQLEFLKPSEGDQVEVSKDLFINEIKNLSTFKDWVINYKRDENTIIPLRIDKIEKAIEGGAKQVDIDFSQLGKSYDGAVTMNGLEKTENPKFVSVSVSAGGASKEIVIGRMANHGNAYLPLDSQGEIELPAISETLTAERNPVTRCVRAVNNNGIISLWVVPFVEGETNPVLEETTKYIYSFTNDDVDTDKVTLVKLVVEYNETSGEVTATYVDETKEKVFLPDAPSNVSGKTYVLKLVNGAMQWVEETA